MMVILLVIYKFNTAVSVGASPLEALRGVEAKLLSFSGTVAVPKHVHLFAKASGFHDYLFLHPAERKNSRNLLD